jgi:CheY-like chemotaxis protein
LVIDDEPAIRSYCRMILEVAGYEVREAANGKRGVVACRNEPVDVVLCDVVMPEQDGIATLLELQRDFPALPVIVMSGNSRSKHDYLQDASLLGTTGVLPKPFGPEQLMAAVRAALPTGPGA